MPPRLTITRAVTSALFFILFAAPLWGAPVGPTLHFDYGCGTSLTNPLIKFMYFVPLVSPELISVSTTAGNTQCARVLSYSCGTNGKSFRVTCEFEFAGEGDQQNIFDNSPSIQLHEQELKAGNVLAHQIKAITVSGAGNGTLEIDGLITNGVYTVGEIRMRFDSHGHISPVNIDLADIAWRNGAIHYDNEMVARVSTLTFRRTADPKMEVTLDSIKRKGAADSLWQNFLGGVKGMAANLFLPPIRVTVEGNQAMMNFGQALAAQKPDFTFPFATRLKSKAVAGR
jgi:hypothetical protein